MTNEIDSLEKALSLINQKNKEMEWLRNELKITRDALNFWRDMGIERGNRIRDLRVKLNYPDYTP